MASGKVGIIYKLMDCQCRNQKIFSRKRKQLEFEDLIKENFRNNSDMKSTLILAILLVTFGLTLGGLTAFQMKLRVSKASCEPASGYASKTTPCYNFRTKKPIPAVECNSPKNSHCCLYKCSCILKGAGTPRGIIPQEHKLSTVPEKKLLADCNQKDSPTSLLTDKTSAKPRSKSKGQNGKGSPPTVSEITVSTGTRKPKSAQSQSAFRNAKPSKRQFGRKQNLQSQASTPNTYKSRNFPKPSRKPTSSKDGKRKPTRKPSSRVPTTKKAFTTTMSTKKPYRTTQPKKPSFSLGFFSRLSSVLNGFGFTSKVTG